MAGWKGNGTQITTENTENTENQNVHSKSSSGLSKGAIACIIIACVVVFIAIIICITIALHVGDKMIENISKYYK